MKTAPALLLLAAIASLAACDRYPDASADDVLSVRIVCPDGRPDCPAIANGAAVLGVEACTKAHDRVDNLKVTLRIAPLEWQNPTDPAQRSVYTASLSSNPCVVASFATRTTPDLVRIDAEMAGTRVDPIWIQTMPADVADVELLPQPAVLTTNTTTTVKLSALVLASNGKVTAGTRVDFSAVQVVPPTGTAYIWPGSSLVDLSRNPPTAEATLVTGPSVRSVTVEMTAVPPAVDGAPPGVPLTRDFTLAGSH